VSAQLSTGTTALIGLAALGVVALDAGWQVVRHFTVMAHEGAHALTGLLLNGSFGGIELHADASGGTDISPATGLRAFPIALAAVGEGARLLTRA
jgi:Peptidase M50B-like